MVSTVQGGPYTTCPGFALHLENLTFSEGKINNISAVLLYLLASSLPDSLPTLSCGMQWSINFLGSLETTRLLQHLRVLYQVKQYQKSIVKCESYQSKFIIHLPQWDLDRIAESQNG